MALFTRFWAWSSVSQDIIGEAGGRFSRPAHILSLCLFPITGKKPSVRLPRQAHPISKTLNVKTLVGRAPDFVIAYPKKYKSYNFSRQECKKQGFSRIGGRACYFTRLFARLPKQQKQPLIIKHLQTYFEKVTKSGKSLP